VNVDCASVIQFGGISLMKDKNAIAPTSAIPEPLAAKTLKCLQLVLPVMILSVHLFIFKRSGVIFPRYN
jgi:hypothetical protein